MTRYFNSGLYEETFYTKHNIDFYSNNIVYEDIEYNSELLAEHYKSDLGFEYSDEDDRWEQVNKMLWDALSHWSIYFEPLVFNEEIALECGLTPFTYKGINMLALSGCGMDLSPRLDAYQTLAHNTIDRNSRFFSTANECDKYFEYVLGKDVTNKVLQCLYNNRTGVNEGTNFINVKFPTLNKKATLVENDKEITKSANIKRCKIIKSIQLTRLGYKKISDSLLSDREYLWQNIGGSDCDDKNAEQDLEHLIKTLSALNEMLPSKFRSNPYEHPRVREILKENFYTNVIEVVAEDEETFYVNTEGFPYARYVGKLAR